MVKRVTSKNTKAEILSAFKELNKEKNNLEAQLQQLNKEKPVAVKNQSQTTTMAVAKNSKKQVDSAQKGIDQTIKSLELIQVGFGSAASDLSEQLIAEASSLEKLRTGVNEEKEQLQELHAIEAVTDESLDELIETYETSSKEFREELEQSQETLGQQIQDLKTAWLKEQENHRREINERNNDYSQSKKRNEEEYQYNLKLERNLTTEEYEIRQANLYKELEEAKQEQEKQWREREEAIAEREKRYAEVKLQVENHKEELEKNIKNGKDNGRNIGNYQGKVKADLRNKEIEGEKQNYELRIQGLEETIDNQAERLMSLNQQLDAALKQVQDLAVKAIEGTSNRNSFEAMKEIAIEQAKNPQKGK